MARANFNELLEAGVHFGHLKRKWNPNMAPYIFMERSGIHIIDLYKTAAKLEEAASAMKQIAKSGRKILFVATKKQAKEIVAKQVKTIGMPYMTERWPGGMLTNFSTIRKAVRKMASIDKMMNTATYNNLSKRERLQIQRERAKLEKQLGSISDLNRLPSAIFVVDINKEHIAIAEAKKLNIPTFAIVDTNSNPLKVDFPIPANDDASKSIELIVKILVKAVEEGLMERRVEKDKKAEEEEKAKIVLAESETIAQMEEVENEEAEKRGKKAPVATKVKVKKEGAEAPKPVRTGEKRPRRPISKPNKPVDKK
ncbi:MAG: 30S ribosomal protein S2 [Bacteroidales bacterium]|nr:30S ribosomal protein S2 [Bacteroidales bacterium]